jgi:hypothetical protein
MPQPTVTVYVTAGEPRRTWCNTCQTGGGIEIDLYALSGLTVTRIATHRTCATCEENDDARPD